MCAIAGIADFSGEPDLRALLGAMTHRGPDETRFFRSGVAAIGVARLAIMDPENGSQPMVDEASGTAVAFNGEIYNAPELRRLLQAAGRPFRTRCDTEVVLAAWLEWGDAAFEKLSGMFAIAILEPTRLVLARDRYGIKPLHFVATATSFRFASEAEALAVRPSLGRQALADFVALAYPTGTATYFETIAALPAGHLAYVTWADGVVTVTTSRFHLPLSRRDGNRTLDEAEAEMEAALDAAVETHLAADSPVAVALSGGIDSSLIAVLAAGRTQRPLKTFTVASRRDHPDAIAAARLAASVGADHRLVTVSFDEFLTAIPATIAAAGAPDLLAGPLFLLLCREIVREAKVCFNGEGADELFGGYPWHVRPAATLAEIEAGFRRAVAAGLRPSRRAEEIRERLRRDASLDTLLSIGLEEQLQRAHLDPVDRMAMATSLEMRLPFLDDLVQDVGRRLPAKLLVDPISGMQKHLLRRIALRRFPAAVGDIAYRPKMMMPDAAGDFATRFERLCRTAIPEDVLRQAEFGPCFETAGDFVLFELFREIFFVRGRHDLPDMRDFFARLTGGEIAAAA